MENQTPVTPVVTPQVVEQPKSNNFLLILLSILLLISVSIAGFFAFQTQKLVGELRMKNEELKNTATTTEPTADPTANWKTYEITEVNTSFKIPPELESGSQLKKQVDTGEKGNEVSYFTSTANVVTNSYLQPFLIKLVSSDFVVGRESSFFDINGYRKVTNGYEYSMYGQNSSLPSNLVVEKTNSNGVSYLLIRGDDKLIDRGGDMVMYPINGTPGKGNIGAIINTKDSKYPGIVIFAKLDQNLTQEKFDQILSTFKFTN